MTSSLADLANGPAGTGCGSAELTCTTRFSVELVAADCVGAVEGAATELLDAAETAGAGAGCVAAVSTGAEEEGMPTGVGGSCGTSA